MFNLRSCCARRSPLIPAPTINTGDGAQAIACWGMKGYCVGEKSVRLVSSTRWKSSRLICGFDRAASDQFSVVSKQERSGLLDDRRLCKDTPKERLCIKVSYWCVLHIGGTISNGILASTSLARTSLQWERTEFPPIRGICATVFSISQEDLPF